MKFKKINDKKTITHILEYGPFNDTVKRKSLAYRIDLTIENVIGSSNIVKITKNSTITENTIIPIGFFIKNDNTFCWTNNVNYYFYVHFIKFHKYNNLNYLKYFSKKLLNDLFLNKNPIDCNKYNKNIIPYIIAMISPGFDLIKFVSNDGFFYALIDIGIDDNFYYREHFLNKFIPVE